MRFVDFESYRPLSRISGNNIHEVGIPTELAYCLAAQAQEAHYWAWLRVYVERKRLG